MRSLKTKWLAGFIALVMVLTLGACTGNTNPGNSGATEPPAQATQATEAETPATDGAGATTAREADLTDIIPSELTNLTVYSQLANFSGEQAGWAAEILKEKFNVKLTIVNDAIDGTFATRMASGNLGDIVLFGSDGDNYKQAVQGGMLYDWNEDSLVQDYGPYIYANMQQAMQKNAGISGGKTYGFGYNVAANTENHGAFFYYPDIRYDLYKAAGSPALNTLEDFIPLLEKMQQLEPATPDGNKTYGVSLFPDWDGDMVMEVKATAGLYGWDEFGFGLYNVNTQTYEDCLKPDGMYLRCLKFYNTMFQKGLLDPDSMTQDFNTMYAKYANGQAFWNIFSWIAEGYNSEANDAAGKRMEPIAAADQKNIVYGLNVLGGDRPWAIGAKTNYPELCMAIINWLSTPEGVMDYNYGPKGLTWDYNADGDTYLTDIGLAAQKDKDNTQLTYGGYTGSYNNGVFQHNNTTWSLDSTNPDSASGESYNWIFWKSTIASKVVSPIEKDWQTFSGYPNADEYLEGKGHISLSLGTSFVMGTRDNALETTWQQVKQSIKSGSWNAIYAKTDAEFDSIVAKMTSDAKAYGYDDCVTWCQGQADLRKAAEDAVK